MYFPKYWASATRMALNANYDAPAPITTWGWSDLSLADAEAQAATRAQAAADRFSQHLELNRYGYPNRPFREPVLATYRDGQGRESALITRNSYGAQVLNTAQAMFVDIDLNPKAVAALDAFAAESPAPYTNTPPAGPEVIESASLLDLARKALAFARPTPPQKTAPAALTEIAHWAAARPDVGLRVYRTAAGLRVLFTTELFDPTAAETHTILKTLKSDPLYARLCQAQACFRARLSPKYWRINLPKPPSRYPFATQSLEFQFRQWDEHYTATATRYATCRLLRTFGPAIPHPDIAPIIKIHDHYCCPPGNLPLA
jgi:hypothetical protein